MTAPAGKAPDDNRVDLEVCSCRTCQALAGCPDPEAFVKSLREHLKYQTMDIVEMRKTDQALADKAYVAFLEFLRQVSWLREESK